MSAPFTYPHIPDLKELLPKTGGLPGITYLQCAAHNQHKAESDGWVGVTGARSYLIQNPDDSSKHLTMVLLCTGTLIKGVSPFSGTRECWVDTDVEKLTGLEIPTTVEETSTIVKAS